ncbi:hypothetical protein EVG20_g9719 [Dentipellis fragilis]|uniref:F-box domain-containing protein n=1 Tax=Dentipellis fragilis TaxID=205917 RepID=A0A4Y9XVW2_9AGAM|nr:hypothetical protein EVG20_g9719 [Dentipellis fragilis]
MTVESAKTLHNARAPISRLLPDALPHVFAILSFIEPQMDLSRAAVGYRRLSDQEQRRKALGWIRVTHVCTAWRESALCEPRLWSHVTPWTSRKWAAAMVARSKASPLTFIANLGEESDKWLKLAAEVLGPKHLSRLRYFMICAGPSLVSKPQLLPTFSGPASVLDSLEIHSPYGGRSAVVPPSMLDVPLPALRRFVLRGWFLSSWSAPFLQNLTDLRLSLSVWDMRSLEKMPTFPELLQIVARSPMLSILTLENILGHEDVSLPADFVPVVLSHLTELTLVGPALTVTCFLQAVDIPTTTSVSVTSIGELEEQTPLIALQTPRFTTGPPLRTLLLGSDLTKPVLVLQAWDSEAPSPHSQLCIPRPRLSFRVDLPRRLPEDVHIAAWKSLMFLFCTRLRAKALDTLTFGGDLLTRLNADDLRELFVSRHIGLSGLTRLAIIDGDMTVIFPLLTERAPDDQDGGPLVLPLLRYLDMQRSATKVPDVKPLMVMLQDRCQRGLPIRSLMLRMPCTERAWVKMMESSVEELCVRMDENPVGAYLGY